MKELFMAEQEIMAEEKLEELLAAGMGENEAEAAVEAWLDEPETCDIAMTRSSERLHERADMLRKAAREEVLSDG